MFDPYEPDIIDSDFAAENQSASPYGEYEQEIPANAPEPRGIGFTMRVFVDSDHSGDIITRRSRTGFIIFLNSAPIFWFYEKKTSVETSSFGVKFVAIKQCWKCI